jgi:CheY-like chemotaxis protein
MAVDGFGARLRAAAASTAKSLAGGRMEVERLEQAQAAMAAATEAIDGASRAARALLEAVEQQVLPSLDEMMAMACAMGSDRRLSASVRSRVETIRISGERVRAILTGMTGQPCAKAAEPLAEPITAASEPPAANFPAFADAPAFRSLRPLRVLAVEANGVHQLVLRTLLAQIDIEPEIVADGAGMIEAWQREPWDLILMDVHAPDIDGAATARMIRSAEMRANWLRTPIVALSGNPSGRDIAAYAAAGMDGCVAKPIAGPSLFAAIEAALAAPEPVALAEVA